jgi:hypothetical protein
LCESFDHFIDTVKLEFSKIEGFERLQCFYHAIKAMHQHNLSERAYRYLQDLSSKSKFDETENVARALTALRDGKSSHCAFSLNLQDLSAAKITGGEFDFSRFKKFNIENIYKIEDLHLAFIMIRSDYGRKHSWSSSILGTVTPPDGYYLDQWIEEAFQILKFFYDHLEQGLTSYCRTTFAPKGNDVVASAITALMNEITKIRLKYKGLKQLIPNTHGCRFYFVPYYQFQEDFKIDKYEECSYVRTKHSLYFVDRMTQTKIKLSSNPRTLQEFDQQFSQKRKLLLDDIFIFSQILRIGEHVDYNRLVSSTNFYCESLIEDTKTLGERSLAYYGLICGFAHPIRQVFDDFFHINSEEEAADKILNFHQCPVMTPPAPAPATSSLQVSSR